MIKKALSLVAFVMMALIANAQPQPQVQPLPLNPDVKSGKLDNGLSYYILHNEEPKGRANFYIAQKVGSTLETKEQLGLAHFLEHMAFNGTKHYPGKAMLNYLQTKGIRFGSDINAYTAFDETVYNIDNVSTDDQALMDSVLLVLYDWSGGILLETDEIEAERGVIEEEWRSRSDANSRMREAFYPQIYEEYQYQQSPIGKMEVVRNFAPDVLRAYYKKWYRPDQQGIVIVGDFDAAAMEAKVKEMFSSIVMPENAAERTYPSVSDNEKPIFAYFDDPETQYPIVLVSFKSDKTPFEYRNTLQSYIGDDLMTSVISQMINNRLSEYSEKPECKYAYAGVRFDDFWVSKTKDAFNWTIIGKQDVSGAFEDAAKIIIRACKTGFTASEYERVKSEMTSAYEKLYNERNNTRTSKLAKELIRHFVDNEPCPGIETEYEIVKNVLQQIPVEYLNQVVSQVLTPNNQVFAVAQPRNEQMEEIKEETFVSNFENLLNAEYEAYVDEVITDPLISKLPKKGKVKSEATGPFDTKVLTLSNGVKVIVKTTDFKADEIQMQAFANGGRRSYSASDALSVKFVDDAFSASKIGNFDKVTLQKYLAGKQVGVDFSIGNTVNYLEGSSTVKDLPTLMELVYASFTQLSADNETFASALDQTRTALKNIENDPTSIYSRRMSKLRYDNNPMFNEVEMADLDKVNYESCLNLIKKALSNAADFTFVFTGNVDVETLKPLLEQYIASLPANAKKKTEVKELTNILSAQGQLKDEWKQPMLTPSTLITDFYSDTNLPYSIENATKVSLVGNILRMVFTETLREEEGGAYSPWAQAFMQANTNQWTIFYQVQTNADQQAKMISRADEELQKLLKNGATADQFNKVKEAALKQYENNVRTNNYWTNNLVSYELGHDNITNNRAAIENLTLEELNSFMKTLYNGKNRVQVIMEGVQK